MTALYFYIPSHFAGIITNNGRAKCSCCDEEFSDYDKFEEHSHSKECSKNQSFQCDECGSVLKTKKSLKRHMMFKHTEHRYISGMLKFCVCICKL